jgi:hypothetical protein
MVRVGGHTARIDVDLQATGLPLQRRFSRIEKEIS